MTEHSPHPESERWDDGGMACVPALGGTGVSPVLAPCTGEMPVPPSRQTARQAIDGLGLFAVILWLGLITGLVEGFEILMAHWLNWIPWNMRFLGHSPEVVWVATVVDLCVFGVLGAVAAVVTRLTGRRLIIKLSIWAAVTLTFLDWLAVPLFGRLAFYALLILTVGLAVTVVHEGRKYQAPIVRFCRRFVLLPVAVAGLLAVTIQSGLWLHERQAEAAVPPASPGAQTWS